MINTETVQVTYLTRADQTTRYSIPFVYNKNELTDAPELTVTLNGTELVFGTDYTVNESGLQLVSAVEEGLELIITRTSVFEQLRDFQTGIIDPEQIEGGFDDSVMRDQELKRDTQAVAESLETETGERINADTILQGAIDDEAAARILADGALQTNIDNEALARANADAALQNAVNSKQDVIQDLATIRSGAAAGATAVQPGDLAAVATTGSYNDLSNKPTIPTVGAGSITITQGGEFRGSFNVNQSGNTTIDVDVGGGGNYSAGTGIDITNDVISVDDPVLTNKASVGNSLVIGESATTSATLGGTVVVGSNARSTADRTTVLGWNARSTGEGGVAIGTAALASRGGITISSRTGTASLDGAAQNEFTVLTDNGKFTILQSDGTIPEARLASTTGATSGKVLTLDSNLNAVWDTPTGSVTSVNGQTGVVVLSAANVGALPSSTKYGASLVLSVDSSTYVVTATLKDQDGNTLGTAQTIDLPLESVVVSGAYDSATKEVVLTLQGGSTVRFSVADLVSGLQTEITSLNMLSADLVDDSTTTHKFVTAADKTTWSGKQDYISDLGTIRSGASAGATAVQPGDLATVATSGSYSDLTDKPTIPPVGAGTITITQGGTTKGSFSVNQSTDATIDIDVGGGSFVPQYETLPQSTPERIGEIAQYVGEYTGSYSAVGSASLGTISVDNDKFASVIRGDGGKTHVFMYDNTGAVAYWNQGEYSWNISSTLAAWDALCVALIGSTSDGTGLAYNGDNNWTLNWSVPVTTSQLESYGLVITGTPNSGESVFVGVARNGGWYRDGSSASYPTVDISDTYGISYTGTPGNGDSITVTTLWEYIAGYFYECVSGLWQQINTQPVPQQTTITIITED